MIVAVDILHCNCCVTSMAVAVVDATAAPVVVAIDIMHCLCCITSTAVDVAVIDAVFAKS